MDGLLTVMVSVRIAPRPHLGERRLERSGGTICACSHLELEDECLPTGPYHHVGSPMTAGLLGVVAAR